MSDNDRHFESFAAWYESGPNSRYMRTRHSVDVLSVAELAEPAGFYHSPPLPNLSVFQALSSGSVGRCDVGAGPFADRNYKAGEFTVIRSGLESRVVFNEDHVFRIFNLPLKILNPLFEEAGLAPSAIDFGLLHQGMTQNQRVTAALDLLWDEAAADQPLGRLAAECAVSAVGVALLRTAQQLEDRLDVPQLRPCDWRLRWVMEQMASRLDEDIGLLDLAASVELSQTHLTTLFRAATGMPPYQWLLQKRLERARGMLARTRSSITEIALSCGFASSQHLATAFKKSTGGTPSEFRSARR